MLMAMMVTVSSFAQDASLQQGAVSPSGRAENVETIYTMILVICAAAFLCAYECGESFVLPGEFLKRNKASIPSYII